MMDDFVCTNMKSSLNISILLMKCASDYKDLTGDGGDKHSVNYRVTSCNQLRANTNVAGPWF